MRGTANGSDLKSIFLDLSTLFKKYDRAKVFRLDTEKDSLRVTTDVGMYYTRAVDFTWLEGVVNMSITLLFADMSHFIPSKQPVDIEVTEYYVVIKGGKSTVTLQVGESIISPYVQRTGDLVSLDFATLRNVYSVFNATTDLRKAFNRDFAIVMMGDYAIMKSPTVWIKTASRGLICILSFEQLRSIVAYQPNYVAVSDRLEFHKGRAILSIPSTLPYEDDNFEEHVSKLTACAKIDTKGIARELSEVKKAVGVSSAVVHVHPEGLCVSISRSGVELEDSYNVTGDAVYTFKCMIDILVMCLNVLGEDHDITVSAKEGLVCLSNPVTSILMSVEG